MNLEKDKSYSITYATKSGETKSIELTPEQDMNTPKLINYLKNQDNEFFKLLDDKTECLDKQNNLNQLEENKMNIKNESKTQFSGMEFEKLIPHTMRFKEYKVLENSFDLYWVTQQPFTMDDLKQFQKALINDTPFAKAYVTVRDFSAYDPNEVNTKDIFAIVTFDKIDATGYMKACEQLGWLDEDEKDPSTWVINNVVTSEQATNSNEETLTEAKDKELSSEKVTTLYDLLLKVEGIDISDVAYDMEVYFEFDPDDVGKSDYDTYLSKLAKNLHCISYTDDHATVDMYKYVENNFDELCNIFDLSGQNKEECIEELVVSTMPGIISGYTSDSTYSELLNKSKFTEAEDKDTDTTSVDTNIEPDIDFEDVDTYPEEETDNVEVDTENQEEIAHDIETATEEVSNEATDTDVLAVEVSNSSIDVLLADEQSAIDGYNAFLAQCKDTLLPALYNVLETEIKEIIADEEEHITKLNTIKSAFHLQATPLDENKSIKTESIEDGATIFEMKFDCSNEDTFGVGHDLEDSVSKVVEEVASKVKAGRLDGAIMDINGNKIGSYGLGYEGVQSGLQESKSIENYFENIDTLEALKDRVDELYDEEKIDDNKYDEIIDYLDQRMEEVDNYIEARSKVTNTDERDIAGIIEDNTIDAIKTIGKMLNESKDLDESNK